MGSTKKTKITMTPKALQNVLTDAFQDAGEGREIDLYDMICAECCYDYDDAGDDDGGDEDFSDPRVGAWTFRDAGVLTSDAGLVVTIGSREYQITIVRSK